MADKLQSAREYILRRIDAGEFRGGEKLPSALLILAELKSSLQENNPPSLPGNRNDSEKLC